MKWSMSTGWYDEYDTKGRAERTTERQTGVRGAGRLNRTDDVKSYTKNKRVPSIMHAEVRNGARKGRMRGENEVGLDGWVM